MLAEFGINH